MHIKIAAGKGNNLVSAFKCNEILKMCVSEQCSTEIGEKEVSSGKLS